ncbi:hypothetical protein Tco_1215764 [Tanacetum coccineum]
MLTQLLIRAFWKRLKDLFHNNKDARVTQLDNEIRNMTIGSSSVTNFFQEIKSKADRLANLDSPVQDSSLVTYAVNGIRSKYPDSARVIRLREKAPTFEVVATFKADHAPMEPVVTSNMASKPTESNITLNHGQQCAAQTSPPVYSAQTTNIGYVYFSTGPSSFQQAQPLQVPQTTTQAHPIAFGPTDPFQQAHFGGTILMAQPGPPGPSPHVVTSQYTYPGGMAFPQ